MNCRYCHGVGIVAEQQTRFYACDAPQPFVVENLPALVCVQCGDKSFRGEAVTALEKIKDGNAQVSSVQTIRVFDFERLDKGSKPVTADASMALKVLHFMNQKSVISRMQTSELQYGVTHTSRQPAWEKLIPKLTTKIGSNPAVRFSHFNTVNYSDSPWCIGSFSVNFAKQHGTARPANPSGV